MVSYAAWHGYDGVMAPYTSDDYAFDDLEGVGDLSVHFGPFVIGYFARHQWYVQLHFWVNEVDFGDVIKG